MKDIISRLNYYIVPSLALLVSCSTFLSASEPPSPNPFPPDNDPFTYCSRDYAVCQNIKCEVVATGTSKIDPNGDIPIKVKLPIFGDINVKIHVGGSGTCRWKLSSNFVSNLQVHARFCKDHPKRLVNGCSTSSRVCGYYHLYFGSCSGIFLRDHPGYIDSCHD